MRKQDTLFIGLMLFALFFGAGNLIYPPYLGMEAGTSYWKAISGFVITGVGLPILAVAAVALVKNGAQEMGNRVHPVFGLYFTALVYLSIGPFFGIPRGAAVAFEMGVRPFTAASSWNDSVTLAVFSLLFFALVYWVSLNPSKIVDTVGQWLTPALLLAILALCIASFVQFNAPLQAPAAKYEASPFFTGFVEGYLTMDTIAALAFGIIVITAFQERGVKNQKQMLRYTLKAGLIAGSGLAFVYVALGWMGAKMASAGSFENGTAILTTATEQLFGQSGKLLLGTIVALACFTTCVGLTTACGQYFTKLFPKASYKFIVSVITLGSFLIANLGLNQIISISVPVLVFVYPLAIVLIVLSFFHRYLSRSRAVYAGAMLMTGLVSLYDGLKTAGLKSAQLQVLADSLPFASFGLGWIVPALIGGLLGFSFAKLQKNSFSSISKEEKAS